MWILQQPETRGSRLSNRDENSVTKPFSGIPVLHKVHEELEPTIKVSGTTDWSPSVHEMRSSSYHTAMKSLDIRISGRVKFSAY